MFAFADRHSSNVLITGGAGFIGTNLAQHLLAHTNARITIVDNLSRPGSEQNVRWLREQALPYRLSFIAGDAGDRAVMVEAARNVDAIYHLSTTDLAEESLQAYDMRAKAVHCLFEALSASGRKAPIVFASSSQVYGPLLDLPVRPNESRYVPANPGFVGVSESAPLDPRSPWNRAQIAAERSLQNCARERNLPAVVLRLDAVAGPRLFKPANRDWIARLVYSVLAGGPVPIQGDGRQVYDVLHVADVVTAMIAACDYAEISAGKVYNIGGGYPRSMSVLEMLSLAERVCHRSAHVIREPSRADERRLYFADSSSFQIDTGWRPRRTIEQGVREIAAFWHANRDYVQSTAARRHFPHNFSEAA